MNFRDFYYKESENIQKTNLIKHLETMFLGIKDNKELRYIKRYIRRMIRIDKINTNEELEKWLKRYGLKHNL
jgi:hypothetical protein